MNQPKRKRISARGRVNKHRAENGTECLYQQLKKIFQKFGSQLENLAAARAIDRIFKKKPQKRNKETIRKLLSKPGFQVLVIQEFPAQYKEHQELHYGARGWAPQEMVRIIEDPYTERCWFPAA